MQNDSLFKEARGVGRAGKKKTAPVSRDGLTKHLSLHGGEFRGCGVII